jgi:hypothetical protein
VVLAGVYAWAAQAGGSLTKPVGKVRSAKSPRTPKVPGAPSAPRSKYALTAMIHVVIGGNPFRSGSKIARVHDVLKDGMTLASYDAAIHAIPDLKKYTAVEAVARAVKAGLITVS